jgi:redox-sensitive bicupin YhaK (pirin superfamily)
MEREPARPLSRRALTPGAAAAAAAGGLAACAGGVRDPDRLAAAAAAAVPGTAPAGDLVPASSVVLRASEARGHANHGWLDTRHTFSFASYYDPRHMGFRSLRVINEDHVAAGQGFPMHPHRDMEIVTYVLEGELEHEDTIGNGSVIRPSEVQQMSAGRGIRHSEYNPSRAKGVHLLQIWIEPDVRGVEPSYDQKVFPVSERGNRLRVVASGDGREGSIRIHSATSLYAAVLEPGRTVEHAVEAGRHAWVQVARGSLDVNGRPMKAGDGAAVSRAGLLALRAGERGAEILVFDLA